VFLYVSSSGSSKRSRRLRRLWESVETERVVFELVDARVAAVVDDEEEVDGTVLFVAELDGTEADRVESGDSEGGAAGPSWEYFCLLGGCSVVLLSSLISEYERLLLDMIRAKND